jgi:hypothetical protein
MYSFGQHPFTGAHPTGLPVRENTIILTRHVTARIIHIPLSGGDGKAQAKGIRYAHGIRLFQPWFFYFSLRRFHLSR